jgi:molybdopterin-containing oxidoreductase family iron-sulfur binding subunit
LLVLAVNQILASEAFPSGTRQIRKGSNEKVAQLIEDMKAGSVHTLIMSGVNPVYTLADTAFVEGLKKVTTSVSLTLKEHETALVSTIAAPFHIIWRLG